MATGGTDASVEGLGAGKMQWIAPFKLVNESGTEMFSVSSAGVVNSAGSTATQAGNLTITNTAPQIVLADSTGSAKDLEISVDGNFARLKEDAGAAGSLLTLDLANDRVGIATASPAVALDVTGAANISGDVAVATNKFTVASATGNTLVAGTLDVTGVLTPGGVARTAQKRFYSVGAKAGATAGWTVNAGANLYSHTLPASQTSSTLVIPISGLKVGDTITAFHLVGQIESAGNTASITADLRKLSAAAADLSDASVGEMAAPLSVTGDTIISASNAVKSGLSDVVGADESFYVLITGTTAASTDIDLMGVAVTVTEA